MFKIPSAPPTQSNLHGQFVVKLTFAISLIPELPVHGSTEPANGTSNGTKQRKKKKSKNDHHVEADPGLHDPGLDMSTSPETSTKKKSKESTAQLGAGSSSTKKKTKSK